MSKKTQVKEFVVRTDYKPIFMIGFPRSGTTLLDTILRTHSKTIVLEEQPYLLNLRHEFFKTKKISSCHVDEAWIFN